jgi:uncharacterized protein (DUF1330 family)
MKTQSLASEKSMPAYLIGQIKVKDETLWQKYVAGVQESLAPFDATIVFRGRLLEVLAGQQDKDLVVVIEFAEQTVLSAWFHSKKYQSLIPLRDEAANVVISAYQA